MDCYIIGLLFDPPISCLRIYSQFPVQLIRGINLDFRRGTYGTYRGRSNKSVPTSSSIGHPPHSSASPVELRLRVGPRALSGKKKEVRYRGVLKSVRP